MTGWSDRRLRRLAWAGWWVTAISVTVGGVVTSIGSAEAPASWGSSLLGELAFHVVVLTFPLVGLAILVRQPRNRIGWLLEGVGLSWSLTGPLDSYAHYGLVVSPGSVPGPTVAAAINEGTWVWGILMMGVFLILLFPDGRLPTPRWRVVAWVAGAVALVVPAGIALTPGTLEEAPVPGVENPLAVAWLETPALVLTTLFLPLIPLSVVAAATSLALRFRSAHGVQREQIKWLATAGAIVAVLYTLTLATTLGSVLATGGQPEVVPLVVVVLQEVSIVSFLLLPVAIGAAILRHRLFDLDLVINRALVYGSLTATLAALYLGSVLLLQLVLRPLTVDSDLAVAGSTLTVAAVFGPARRWIQGVVDRRFYRHRYDAALALDAFAGRLRHEVDLDAVGADLLEAVRETVHPTHVTVWLPGTRRTP